jgi:hypothetical protein
VLLAFLCLLEEPSRRRASLFGAVLGATFLVDPQLAILAVSALVPLGVARRRDLAEAWQRLVAAAALAGVVAAPLLVPLVGAAISGESGRPTSATGSMVYSSSLLSWVAPPLERLWIGHLGTVEPLTPTLEGIAYPGLVVLALAGAGVALRARDERRGWVAVTVVGVVLSFGPHPYVRGTFVDVPLPFLLVRAVPGMDAFRVPGRFAVVGALGLTVLAACGLAALAQRHPRHATALTVVACAITVVELLPRSLPEAPREAPAPYAVIADHPDPGAVLEIPMQWSTGQDAIGYAGGRDEEFLFLLNAIEHGRPTVSGAVSRYPDERLDQLLDIDLYRQVLTLQGEPGFDEAIDFDRTDLVELGIGFIAYDRSDPAPRALSHVRSLDLPVLADDGTVIVWWVDG